MRRTAIAVLATVGLLLTGNEALARPAPVALHSSAADRPTSAPAVLVTGAVATSITYSAADLAGFPQTTLPLSRPGDGTHGSVTGASLLDVVLRSGPLASAPKNPLLRVAITATGDHGRQIAVAYGELDPGFGNHAPASALSPSQHRPWPGSRNAPRR